MRNKKSRLETFSFYDHTGIQKHLEKMAAKGWLLEKITSYRWIYRRIEPVKLTFAVTYFANASEFDPSPTEEQQIFLDFCGQEGWKIAAMSAQMQIFYNEKENPVPIETDAAVQVENIHRAVKRNFLIAQFVLLVLGVFQESLFLDRLLKNTIDSLARVSNLVSGLCWILVIILNMTEIMGYFLWHAKAKKAAEEEGVFVATRSHRVLQIGSLCLVAIAFLWWFLSMQSRKYVISGLLGVGYMVLLFFLVNMVKIFLKRRKVSRNVNRVVTFVSSFAFSFGLMGIMTAIILRSGDSEWFTGTEDVMTYEYHGITWEVHNDRLPLRIEDFSHVQYEEYSCEWQAETSFLLEHYTASQTPRMDAHTLDIPDLSYEIYRIQVPALYNLCLDQLLDQYKNRLDRSIPEEEQDHFVEVDAEGWGSQVQQVYRLYFGDQPQWKYILCWEEQIVELDVPWSWELTSEQMEIIAEKLSNLSL